MYGHNISSSKNHTTARFFDEEGCHKIIPSCPIPLDFGSRSRRKREKLTTAQSFATASNRSFFRAKGNYSGGECREGMGLMNW